MADDKVMFSVRLPEHTKEQIQDLADERGMSQSDMARQIINSGLNVEREDRFEISVQDPEPVADGGQVVEKVEQIQHTQDRLTTGLILAALYIVLEVGIGIPAIVSIPLGIALIVGLLYYSYKSLVRGDKNE